MKWFYLALDESTIVINPSQLFIQGIDAEFEVMKELASINNLHCRTAVEISLKVEKVQFSTTAISEVEAAKMYYNEW